MSWSNIFYPGNPERRRTVVKLLTELMTLMEGNFNRTNDLIDVLHEHLPGKTFLKIFVDHNKTIRDNCNVLINRITEIQKYLSDKQNGLQDLLEPDLYWKIMDTKVSFTEKLEQVKNITGATLTGIGTLAGIIVCSAIVSGGFLVALVAAVGTIAACGAAAIVVGVVFLGVDMIASAIIGATEREKLENSIKDLKEALEIFKPSSYEYSTKIEKVIVMIEIKSEKQNI